ncbi:MAG TPA: GTP-binding protein, partial [Sphingobacteriaceae bacterium]
LGVSHVVVAVNKMDMVDYDSASFSKIQADYKSLAAKLRLNEVTFIPVSALKGDNIVKRSPHMVWYTGKSLLEHLETVIIEVDDKKSHARFPVQWVIRPQTDELHDYRGYAGRVVSGSFRPGDAVTVLPSGFSSTISRIEMYGAEPVEAVEGMSVTLHLKDNIDISRGDMLVSSAKAPVVSREIEADLCWMDTRALDTGVTYLIQHNSKLTKCKIQEILYKVNINNLEKVESESFSLNDIGRVIIRTADALPVDLYQENKRNGGAILIDSRTNLTVGALMFRAATEY